MCERARWAVLGAGLCLLASGCTATFREPRLTEGAEHSLWASYFLYGSLGHFEVDVRDHCASGRASELETGADVLTVGASVLTAGIYTPRRVWVTCAPPARP